MISIDEIFNFLKNNNSHINKLKIVVNHPIFGMGFIISTFYSSNKNKDIAEIKFEKTQDSHHIYFDRLESIININSLSKKDVELIRNVEKKRVAEEKRILEIQREKAKIAEQKRKEALYQEYLKQKKLDEIKNGLTHDYINIQKKFYDDQEYIIYRDQFIQQWCAKNLHQTPDMYQLQAIGAVDKNIQLIARAGSGKTATTINRTIFLVKHCQVDPHKIMLLAFNKKAANEIRSRLFSNLYPELKEQYKKEFKRQQGTKKQGNLNLIDTENQAITNVLKLSNNKLPHVMTFHALAYAIAKPEQNIIYNQQKGEDEELNEVIHSIIEKQLKDKDSIFFKRVKQIMQSYFKEDWEEYIAEGGLITNKELFIECRRSIQKKTLKGDHVKSYGEKVISNILFENDVSYTYEKNWYWDDTNYKPDFTVYQSPSETKKGIIIEYFGLNGTPDYDKMSEKKRKYWQKKEKDGWILIELYPHDIVDDKSLTIKILDILNQYNIHHKALSNEEIWERIEDITLNEHTRTLSGFIGRCRKARWSVTDLKNKTDNFHGITEKNNKIKEPFPYSVIFHQNCLWLYNEYLETLQKENLEDFDGLLQVAIDRLEAGNDYFRKYDVTGQLKDLEFIFIDEFQDFSILFNQLIQAILKLNSRINLFCVGDDWQAINGFAGADLKFFQTFNHFIKNGQQLYLKKNYRSKQAIVDIGNKLMNGLGEPAIANHLGHGEIYQVNTDDYKPTLVEKQFHNNDITTPIIIRLIQNVLQTSDCKVVLLSRNNKVTVNGGIDFTHLKNLDKYAKTGNEISNYLKLIRSFFMSEHANRISISTTHKYKGLEKDVVIVLDALESNYPFIHPNWFFTSIFEDSIEKIIEAERRLFYVALTRAIHKLYIVTQQCQQSTFLKDIVNNGFPLNSINIKQQSHFNYSHLHQQQAYIAIKNSPNISEGGTVPIKSILTKGGYKYVVGHKLWIKSVQLKQSSKLSRDEIGRDLIDQAHNIDINIVLLNNCNVGRLRVINGEVANVKFEIYDANKEFA